MVKLKRVVTSDASQKDIKLMVLFISFQTALSFSVHSESIYYFVFILIKCGSEAFGDILLLIVPISLNGTSYLKYTNLLRMLECTEALNTFGVNLRKSRRLLISLKGQNMTVI